MVKELMPPEIEEDVSAPFLMVIALPEIVSLGRAPVAVHEAAVPVHVRFVYRL